MTAYTEDELIKAGVPQEMIRRAEARRHMIFADDALAPFTRFKFDRRDEWPDEFKDQIKDNGPIWRLYKAACLNLPNSERMEHLIELHKMVLMAAQRPGIECHIAYTDLTRILTKLAGKSCYIMTG